MNLKSFKLSILHGCFLTIFHGESEIVVVSKNWAETYKGNSRKYKGNQISVLLGIAQPPVLHTFANTPIKYQYWPQSIIVL